MKYIKLTLIILWMFVIFMFSNQKSDDSTRISNGIILKTVRIIEKINHKTYSDEEILNKFFVPVRKAAHFTIYLILGILVYLYIKDLSLKSTFLISIMICCMYACTDEIHQLFVEGRSCEILDVGIDTLGSGLGIFITKIFKK